jgi:hypothetical protein
MNDYNLIKDHNYIGQGTTVYVTQIKEYLRINYFESEPRTTFYWVALIKEMSCKENMHPYGYYWYDLLPPNLSAQLIAEYIDDPRGTIAANVFSEEEIAQLRQPQRILLFYFLKKLSQYSYENSRIIHNFNNILSQDVFRLRHKPAVPDKGFISVFNPDGDQIDVNKNLILDCIVEDEQITRKYVTSTSIHGPQLYLSQAYLAVPSQLENKLCLTPQELPLTKPIYPFRPDVPCPVSSDDSLYYPSIIVTSSLLCMSEGNRKIELTLRNKNIHTLQIEEFDFKITTSIGWKVIQENEVQMSCSQEEEHSLSFLFEFDFDFPPISPIIEIDDEDIYLTSRSALMIGYNNPNKDGFSVQEVDLQVWVEELQPSAIRNQEIVLNTQDDYQPFGVDAELLSTFSFAHPELMHPELEEISITPKWIGAPLDFNSYYAAYKKKKKDFKIKIYTISRAEDAVGYTSHFNAEKELFDSTIEFTPSAIKATHNTCLSVDPEETDPMNFDLYYQLELVNEDFGQSEYPLLMTQYSVQYANYENSWFKFLKKPPLEVNRPYIPLWNNMAINYRSKKVSWTPKSTDKIIDVYKGEAKGYSQYYGEDISLGADINGALYLGFEDPIQQGIGTLFFHGNVGNARAPQVELTWWYLTETNWAELTNHILTDETYGLTQTGIISWSIPNDMSKTNTAMPQGLYWIKATLTPIHKHHTHQHFCRNHFLHYYDSIMSLNGIFANMCAITRQKEELAASNNVTPLKAGSMLTPENTSINYEFNLPYNTSGQVKKESDLNFWARVFNRVRNRGRMVCEQDYEDLLLRNFRNLSVVKAIPRVQGRDYIDIVVINRQVYDTLPYALPPMNSLYDLNMIKRSIYPFSTAFLKNNKQLEINVVNPCYQEVGFMICLEFKEEGTETEKQLNLFQDLISFVNPWRVEEDIALKFGCWFQYSEIISYVQNLPYIKAVFDIKMGIVEGGALTFPTHYQFKEEEILILTNPNMIIAINDPNKCKRLGIGTMIIGEDFIVSKSPNKKEDEPKNENYEQP